MFGTSRCCIFKNSFHASHRVSMLSSSRTDSLTHSLTHSPSLSLISSHCSPLMTPALLPSLPSVLIRFGGSCDHRPNENALPHPTTFVCKEHFPITSALFYFILYRFVVRSFAARCYPTKPLDNTLRLNYELFSLVTDMTSPFQNKRR